MASEGAAATLEVFVAHMGGPFWARKDEHAWSIPKGEYEVGEPPLEAAKREFAEEIGTRPPDADYLSLGDVRYSSGKLVAVFAAEAADFAPNEIVSNAFDVEWTPRSGRTQSFPEVDDARWITIDEARVKLVKAQAPILDRLLDAI